jgi:acyl carrier protein
MRLRVDQLRHEIKTLLIDSLRLEQMTPEQIGDDTPLIGTGLGLDSLDALELAVAIEYRYGFKLTMDAQEGRALFANINSLSFYVQNNRTK